MIRTLTIIILSISLQGCLGSKVTIKGKNNLKLQQVDFTQISGWENDEQKMALNAFIHSCDKFAKMPQNREIASDLGSVTAGDFRDVCEIAEVVKIMDEKQARNFFENWFVPFSVKTRSGKTNGLFTGYYEASLNGSRTKTDTFKYPIYKKPKDLGFDTYYTRKEINDGALAGKRLELLYVDDPVDLFFMHIQGSGRVTLQDGSTIRLGYAGKNNNPYTSISRYLVDRGKIASDQVNAITIKNWLKANPKEAQEIMNLNLAYTFFQISEDENVIGAQNVPLTPQRSLAVDKEIIPYGFPLWVSTSIKNLENSKKESFKKLMIAQDTGSAIKGTVRGDIFFGFGEAAENNASLTASRGKYYILLPVNVIDKL